ncbi:MAG: PEGA domain-containing protein [Gemmatimonadales bacterium]|nr:PEGA domain-containing protein [Gemmatimonadales bacterium]
MAPHIRILPTWLPFLLLTSLLVLPGTGAGAATVELAGPSGSEVFLDGEAIGFLPFSKSLELEPGEYLLRCELPGHQPFEMMVHLLAAEDQRVIMARLMPLSRRTACASNLVFAGMGQHYTGQNLRGWIYNALEIGGLLTALTAELQRSNYRKDYLLLYEKYEQQINFGESSNNYRQETLDAYTDMEDMEQLRDTGFLVAGSAIALSILDSLLLFPSFEAGMGSPTFLNTSAEHVGEASAQTWNTVHMAYRTTF